MSDAHWAPRQARHAAKPLRRSWYARSTRSIRLRARSAVRRCGWSPWSKTRPWSSASSLG